MTDGKASRDSQLGSAPCEVCDTEEMVWLRETDDAGSKLRLGSLLVAQYRYREAIGAFWDAARIRPDDPGIHAKRGGAALTLFDFGTADAAYTEALRCGADGRKLAFPLGIRDYFAGDYARAAERFSSCFPCDGETGIAAAYWHSLAALRMGLPLSLARDYRPADVGHHTAYRLAVSYLLGREGEPDLRGADDLDFCILAYALARRRIADGDGTRGEKLLSAVIARESVWPSVACLAAWRDFSDADR